MTRLRSCEFCGRDTKNKCGICKVCMHSNHEEENRDVYIVPARQDSTTARDKEIRNIVRDVLRRCTGEDD